MRVGSFVRTNTNQFDNDGIRRGSIGKITGIKNEIANVEIDFVTYKKNCEVKLSDLKLFENPMPPTHTFIGVQD